jgi:phospholipid/cholesterol/gamma-HCH transport system substrate-binding protein
MNKRNLELYTGLFVVVGAACITYLVVGLGGFDFLPKDRYALHGYFSSAAGLKPGARVEIAGVEVGNVADISMDEDRMVARVDLHIDKSLEISEDSIASIKTSGIIGEKYISILPGGMDFMLEDGDEIIHTESSLDIEGLVRKMIFSKDAAKNSP